MSPPRTLFIHPSALARDAALDAACRANAHGAAWTAEHLTLQQLLELLGRALPPGSGAEPREISDAARLGLLKQAFLQVRPREPEPARASLEAAGRLVAGWKGAGLAPEGLASAAKKLARPHARLARRLEGLAELWGAYERLLDNWTDREGREARLLARLRAASRLPAALEGVALEVSGVHRLAPVQRMVFESLRALGVKLSFVPALPLAQPGFETLRASFGSLAGLMHGAAPARASRVERLAAPSQYSELYEIGRRVRHWIEAEGLAPHEIAVAFRDLGPYSQFVADVFGRLQIPYYERRGEPAAFQPLVRAALTAVDAVREGLSREGVFRFLRSGLARPELLAGSKARVAPHELHALALEARVDRFFGADLHRPFEAWGKRLDALKAERPERAMPCGLLKKVLERMDALRAPRPREAFANDWLAFFQGSGLWDAEAPAGPAGHKAGVARQALALALAGTAEGPGAGETVTLERYAEELETAIAGASVRVSGLDRACGVRVLNLYDLRGLRFKRVVFAGLDEAGFPELPAPDALLGSLGAAESRALREALEREAGGPGSLAAVEPRWPREVREEEEALFEIALRAGEERLVLTRSKSTADGRATGASVYWEREEASAVPEQHVAPVRPAPPLAECITGEEAELRAAWVLAGGAPGTPEAGLALACAGAGRGAELLRRAGVEQDRDSFFEALAASRDEAGEINRETPAGPYDGNAAVTAPDAPRAVLDRLSLRPLPATALETQAQCGFRFMVRHLFRMDEEELPGDDLSPAHRGDLWHRILSGFYARELEAAHAAGRVVAVLDPARRREYMARLEQITEALCEAAPGEYFVGRPGLWRMQREMLQFQLGAWLEYELRAEPDAVPFHAAFVEYAFGSSVEKGSGPAVEVSVSGPAGPARLELQGRIDRFDLCLEDPGAEVPRVLGVRLLDYKAGRMDRLKPRLKENNLPSLRQAQLPVYLAAAMRLLEAKEREGWGVDWVRVRENSTAALFALGDLAKARRTGETLLARPDEDGEGAVFLRQLADRKAGPQALNEAVQRAVASALQGRFAVAPVECAGVYCGARFACRYREFPLTDGDEAGPAE